MSTLFSTRRTIDRPTVLLAVRDEKLAHGLERWAAAADLLPVIAVGRRAQQSATLIQFDAVILESGRESRDLWNALETLPGTHRTPVIVVADAFDDRRLLFELGAFAVVDRPVDPGTLTAHVRHAVGDERAQAIAERALLDHG